MIRNAFFLLLLILLVLTTIAFHEVIVLRQEVVKLQERVRDRDLIEVENVTLKARQHHAEADQTELAFLRREAKDVLRLRAKVTSLNALLEQKAGSTALNLQLSNRVQELTSFSEQLQAKLQLQSIALPSKIVVNSQENSAAVATEAREIIGDLSSNGVTNSPTVAPVQLGAFVPSNSLLPPDHQFSNLNCNSCHKNDDK